MDRRLTVLVIDGDRAVCGLLAEVLGRDGFRVVVASDATSGLDALTRAGPDLVVLDVVLPDLPGGEVLRRIRARSDVPVIVLSARGGEDDKVLGLDGGADDYVTKPFGTRELRSRVRAALRRRRPAPGPRPQTVSARLQAGRIVLDLRGRTATCADRPLRLTFVEFELLRMLVAEPGRVFTRLELLDGVWGSGRFRDQRTVDVHVRHLRQKLERDPAEPVQICTVRGVGYRFSEPPGGAPVAVSGRR